MMGPTVQLTLTDGDTSLTGTLSFTVTLTSGGVTLAGSAQTVSSRPLRDTSLRLAHWSETETVWEVGQPGPKPALGLDFTLITTESGACGL